MKRLKEFGKIMQRTLGVSFFGVGIFIFFIIGIISLIRVTEFAGYLAVLCFLCGIILLIGVIVLLLILEYLIKEYFYNDKIDNKKL